MLRLQPSTAMLRKNQLEATIIIFLPRTIIHNPTTIGVKQFRMKGSGFL